ncbi:MAG: dTDP-4-dehydrorhamnose reductase [Chlamydiota bacterium]
MTFKVLVTGSNGQLGQCLQAIKGDYPNLVMTFLSRQDLDLKDLEAVESYFQDHHYDVIVNCAAYTAVDQAESDAEQAEQINHHAVKALAQIAKQQNSKLIHISTDYVFSGYHYKPYEEKDAVDPRSVYGATKLRGEQAIQAINPAAIIIRTSWLFSEYGQNFVKTILRASQEKASLKVIDDQVGSPTYACDLAQAVCKIILHSEFHNRLTSTEIYHFTNEGIASWYDLALAILSIKKIACSVEPISTEDYPVRAQRPYYSVLNNKAIKQTFGLQVPYWRNTLENCLLGIRNG